MLWTQWKSLRNFVRDWIASPPKFVCWCPNIQVTLFGYRALRRHKWGPNGGASSISVLLRGGTATRRVRSQRIGHVKTRQKGGLLQAWREGFTRNQPCTLILDFQYPEHWENRFLLFKPPSVVCCYGSPSGLIQNCRRPQAILGEFWL